MSNPIISLISSIGLLFSSAAHADTVTPTPGAPLAKKPWTFVIYMAADNSLQPDADINIEQLKKIGSNNNINILVHLNTKRPGEQKISQKLVIHNGSVEQVGPTQSLDSGKEETLLEALTWAVTSFPADHYAVDLWNHGAGPLNRYLGCRGVCYDDSTNSYLTDVNVKNVLDQIITHYLPGKKFDFIAFDACLMADIEIAYSLQPYAHLVVSSQETVPGLGFDYTNALLPFKKDALSPRDFGLSIVKTYQHAYDVQQEDYTLSLVNLDQLTPLVTAHKSVAQLLNSFLKANNIAVFDAIAHAVDPVNVVHFTEPTYIDLGGFYNNLLGSVHSMKLTAVQTKALTSALSAAKKALARSVISHVNSRKFAKTSGLSIYFPDNTVEPSYLNLIWAQGSNPWVDLIQTYVSEEESEAAATTA